MMRNEEFRLITRDMERLRVEVMSRVRTVRRIRSFLASPFLSAILTVVFLLCASIFVSFNNIVSNIMAQAGWSGRFYYAYSSLMHTQVAVQIFAFLTSVCCLILFTKILFRLRMPVYSIGNFIVSRSGFKFFRS